MFWHILTLPKWALIYFVLVLCVSLKFNIVLLISNIFYCDKLHVIALTLVSNQFSEDI